MFEKRPITLPVERLRECPKTMLNGPCGGVDAHGGCEVTPDKLCVWYEALAPDPTADATHRHAADWRQNWSDAFAGEQVALLPTVDTLPDRDTKPLVSGSKLERLLHAGQFVVTCEVNPHDSADGMPIVEYARTLATHIDAAHVSDNSLASPHMSNWAVGALLAANGIEPIVHMACRDRNRMALQSDLLGLHALGVRNILCITGDHPAIGDHAAGKAVFDLDSLAWLETARRLRDEGRFCNGERQLASKPRVLLGGAAGVTAPPYEYRPYRLLKKIAAGADFIITQLIFDMDMLRAYLQRVCDMGLDRKVYLLVGVGALPSAAVAAAMQQDTPGVIMPDAIVRRMHGVPVDKQREEGIRICVEQIAMLREMPAISGIDIMDLDPRAWFPTVEIVERAGLAQRPT
jgi:methylenetetrahydrofolate reductase (NADPH)